jgi:hypothetical protein
MWDFLKNLKEFLSLDYRSLFIIACVSWVIVFIPANVWQEIGLINTWVQSRSWAFVIGILATIWLIFGGLYDIIKANINKVNHWIESRKKQGTHEKIILSSSRVEKEVLARYISEDTTTIAFEMRDGIVNGLISKGILYRSSSSSNPMSYDFDTNIQPWAWEYLKSHPDVLKDIVLKNIGRHQIRF